MQNPEVWSFQEPPSSFQAQKFNSSEVPQKDLQRFLFTHLVSVVLPDSLRLPQDIVEVLTNDCEYYKVFNLSLSELLDTTFRANFIIQGNLTLLSIDTRIDCDNCIAVTSDGTLILSLTKNTYQSLGLEGKASHFTIRNKDRYIVQVDLKDPNLKEGKKNYVKTKQALNSLGKFTVIICWTPHDETVCPSSVAKFFDDLGYSVTLCEPKFQSHIVYSVKTPTLAESITESDVEEFVEWLGMVSIEGDFSGNINNYINTFEVPEPNIELGQIRVLQWRGFFQPSQILKLVDVLKEYNKNEEKLWITLYTQGFSDAPIIENKLENNFFTNSDNANLIILNRYNTWYCKQRCSAKRYK